MLLTITFYRLKIKLKAFCHAKDFGLYLVGSGEPSDDFKQGKKKPICIEKCQSSGRMENEFWINDETRSRTVL